MELVAFTRVWTLGRSTTPSQSTGAASTNQFDANPIGSARNYSWYVWGDSGSTGTVEFHTRWDSTSPSVALGSTSVATTNTLVVASFTGPYQIVEPVLKQIGSTTRRLGVGLIAN